MCIPQQINDFYNPKSIFTNNINSMPLHTPQSAHILLDNPV